MSIGGFQPLSLIDFPGRPCSIVFTQGCLFRCSYCHNPDLIPMESRDSSWNEERVLAHLEKRKSMVGAVCITGGEPTIQPDLIDFLKKVRLLGISIKLDTNGIAPQVVKKCIDECLVDYIAMDIKAPWSRYSAVIGDTVIQAGVRCSESFTLIQRSGIEHEFRTTICPGIHSQSDFNEMASYLLPGERYFIQKTSFIKTLDPTLSREGTFDPDELVKNLQERFGSCIIAVR